MAEYDGGIVSEVTKKYDEAAGHHQYFVNMYERRERAYRGVREKVARKSKWRHDNRPPYAFNLLETVVASQVEMGLQFNARPSPHVNATADEAAQMLAMAEDVENLVRHEHRIDGMDQKQRPVYLCDGIGGRGILKNYWNYVPGMIRRQGVKETVVENADGQPIGTMPTIVEIEEQGILRDHSTTEVVDPRDFVIHESALHLDPWLPGGAQHLFHRCWYSYDQLKYMESIGFVQNVDELKDSQDMSYEYVGRDSEVFNINRTKDLIEVLEYWCFEKGEIYYCWVGNRKTVLKPKQRNPFWHGEYPFSVVSALPQPFSFTGTSTIELIEELQSILWELGNQRLDNVELINNAIMLIRSDVEDPDAFEHYPGARWEVDSVDQVAPLVPPYQVAQVSIEAETLLKGDLQTVTSAAPLAGGDSSSVQNNTATGASIVMNAAQQQLAMKKYQAQFGITHEANQRLKNCQQFLDGTRTVHILGPEGAAIFKDIPIISIQGEYLLELSPMSESTMRQERRAEASQFAQLMIGFAPIAAAAGKPLDIEAIIKWFSKKWDIEAPEQFFAAQAAAMGAQQALPGGGGGGGPAPPGPPDGPNMGTTSSTAVDASKPSATGGLGMSGMQFLQKASQLAGGG